MCSEMVELANGFFDRRNVPVRDPPQHLIRLLHLLEPGSPPTEDVNMVSSIDERLQRPRVLPHGQIEHHVVVLERPDRGGVTLVGLETPHETWSSISLSVDRFQFLNKPGELVRVDGSKQAGDVQLSQMHETTLGVLRSLETTDIRPALQHGLMSERERSDRSDV